MQVAVACLSDETVFRFVQGKAAPAELPAIVDHLNACADCREVVAETAKFFFQERPASGARIGRYEVLDPIGYGAAGVVYRAHDPQLERKVALKLIGLDREGGAPAPEARARLLREARAMAQLAHPNVVAVHDAGVAGSGEVFIAMELVEGTTLARWLRERPRPWREVLAAFLEAGRGLAAAHAAGLVHRDFKPENVLLGPDGRARVTDFGLARPGGPAPAPPAGAPAGASTFAGTPAYMAPEQILGRSVDARTDQFGFCVALWAALHGAHPFGTEPGAAARAQAPAPPPEGSDVPPALSRALRRGLAARPEDRFSSMDALLAALAQAAQRTASRLPIAATALGLALVGGALWAARSLSPPVSGFAGRCGNGALDPAEECDDGNPRDDDGCNTGCVRCGPPGGAFTWEANGHCYLRHDRPLPFEEAERACAGDRGGHLVTFLGTPEVTMVGESLLRGHAGPHWIGMRTPSAGENHVWLTREPFIPGMAILLPPGPHPERTCVAQGPERRWETVDCARPLPFVCEVPGWSVYPRDGHAYRPFYGTHTWWQARDGCAAVGAHLATIADVDEHGFLSSRFQGLYWLGAIREGETDPFRWVSGEPFTYQAFVPGDPDVPERPDCLIMGEDRTFRDRPCAGGQGSFSYVCEVD